MRKTALLFAALFPVAAAAPAALAAPAEAGQTWTLSTDGASVSCGTAASL